MKKFILKILYFVLKILAKIYLYRTKPFVIGITGSVGKTSCRMIVSKILSDNMKGKTIYTSPKNFNSEIGLVLSIFTIEKFISSIKNIIFLVIKLFYKSIFLSKKYDILVLEYGIDKPKDMDFLLSIVKPDISIFTKLDSIHAENFPDGKKGILNEKIKLSKNSKQKSYINCSDLELKKEFENLNTNKSCFYNIDKFDYKKQGANIFSEFEFNGKKITTNMLGSENFSYIGLGYEILNDLGFSLKEKEIFVELKNQNARFSILDGINDSILIDSSYNAGPTSMKKMIENTFNINKIFPDYKLLFVVGDMRELGIYSEQKHKDISRFLKDQEVLSVGEKFKKYSSFQNFKNSKLLGEYLKEFLEKSTEKYIILFKGSQNTIFLEESIKSVLKNKSYISKLVRQDESFMRKKEMFFNS